MNYSEPSRSRLPDDWEVIHARAITLQAGDKLWVDVGDIAPGWWGPSVRAVWTDADDRVHYSTVNGGLACAGARDRVIAIARHAGVPARLAA